VLVAIAALAPRVLVPPAMVVAVVEALARLDHASGHDQQEAEENENRSGDGFRFSHGFLRVFA
jgi:hypothetical protein